MLNQRNAVDFFQQAGHKETWRFQKFNLNKANNTVNELTLVHMMSTCSWGEIYKDPLLLGSSEKMTSDFDTNIILKKSSKSFFDTRNILTLGATVAVSLLVITGFMQKDTWRYNPRQHWLFTNDIQRHLLNLNNPETVTNDDLISDEEDDDNADMDPNLPSEPLLFAHDRTFWESTWTKSRRWTECEKIYTADCLYTTIPQEETLLSGKMILKQIRQLHSQRIARIFLFWKRFKKNEIIFWIVFRSFFRKTEKLTERVESRMREV